MTPTAKPLVLTMFTLMCAIIFTAGVIPSVIAQEVTSLDEDLASGIVSNVLDGGGDDEEENGDADADDAETDDQDSTDTATVNPNQEYNNEANFAPQNNNPVAIPIIDQDQRDANLAEQLGLNVDIVEKVEEVVTPTPTPTPTPEEDTTPPTLTVPDIVVEADSTEGAVVTYTVTAEDNVDGTATLEDNTLTQDGVGGDITISCDPPSGSEFPIGTTTVTCTATDEAGNTATASFTITVEDTTPPVLTVPEDITEEATSPNGAVVTFEVTAQDTVDGSVPVTCTPASGSTFPIDTTTVNCEATDEAGNTATASFTVTVIPLFCGEEAATIYGTPGNDDLDGTEGRDVVVLLAGDDRFDAQGGDDLICGDEGIDTINGDAGADVMFGGDGNDIMSGGAGNDDMNGGAGNDVMNGDAGNDVMNGGADNDVMFGGAGNDNIVGSAGTDSANGGPNTDTCDAETETACEA
jgi:Ca2+-binding RTX toxin-like protein